MCSILWPDLLMKFELCIFWNIQNCHLYYSILSIIKSKAICRDCLLLISVEVLTLSSIDAVARSSICWDFLSPVEDRLLLMYQCNFLLSVCNWKCQQSFLSMWTSPKPNSPPVICSSKVRGESSSRRKNWLWILFLSNNAL